MSVRGCGLTRGAREMRRRHFCGTCKVIGREYGQGSRLFLNHDTVLVAEIITALSETPAWGAAIQSRNCFHLPGKAEATPPTLRYAAAATILLASAKVKDHASDSGKLRWRLLARWLNPGYRRAAAELRHWGVPVFDIAQQLATQQQRESAPESLEKLAEPTYFATAEICRHAATVAQRKELEPVLEEFGRRFGYLSYLLDAWEDYEKDAASGDFNAFRALYGNRASARAEVEAAGQAVLSSFRELPIRDSFRDELLVRFQSNFRARFAVTLPVLKQSIWRTSVWAIAGVPVTMTPVTPPKRNSGGKVPGSDGGTWCDGCGDSGCDGCGDSCCDGCSCDC